MEYFDENGGQLTLLNPEPNIDPDTREKRKAPQKPLSSFISIPYLYLDLSPECVDLFGNHYWELRSPYREGKTPLNTGPAPRRPVRAQLSSILERNPDPKYYLSPKACLGILRRSLERGKALPEQLEAALKLQASSLTDIPNLQVPNTRTSVPIGFDGYNGDLTGDVAATLGVNCGMSTGRNGLLHPVAFAANQRDEVRDLHDVAGALGAQPRMKQQTFIAEGETAKGILTPECHTTLTAGFSAGAGASAGGIGYHEELAPTLKGSAGGNCMPSVLCLNDQGGSVMEVTENRTGTLRAQEHGHQPLVYENHGIDARYTGPHAVAPTMSARYGTGGNNVPLVEQKSMFCITGNAIDQKPENGGNGIGDQEDISYTLTATDYHSVFSRQRVDVFKDGKVVSTQSARQHKDATDLVLQEAGGPKLIRRLTPLECERLQGFPDSWTEVCCASDSARYKALGNSVAIPCVEFVLQAILAAVEGDDQD